MKIKIFTILLFFIIVCIGCEKKNHSNDTYNDEHKRASEETDSLKVFSLQEQIESYDEEVILLFQEEGNFTNSGNKEILVFCQQKNSLSFEGIKSKSVDRVYCFIVDETDQKILKAIRIMGYGTLPLSEKNNLDKMPMEDIGREIRWLDRRFGCIGDFNNNGKEELYFFEASGRGIYPAFYEFQENQFKLILDYNSYSVFMEFVNVDKDNKIISFEGRGGEKPENVSFVWDFDMQMYRLINIGSTEETDTQSLGGRQPQ